MDCKTARDALDAAFDGGVPPPVSVRQHLLSCRACAAHARSLEALERALRVTPEAIAPDPALVARIQASIAAQPPHGRLSPAWAAGLAALIAVAVAGGQYVDLPDWIGRVRELQLTAPAWDALAWRLPPMGFDAEALLNGLGAVGTSGLALIERIPVGPLSWAGPLLALGLAAACIVNAREYLGRPRH
ncbi:MAG: hypothetical protein KF886_03410 [Candidatus Hydrogenedentes bacterium]|nr:hypothetical protein [Candidatus Hydrogenedentota bacterium]